MADLTIRIVDEETSDPVPGARVALAVAPLGGASDLLQGESDPSGICRVAIPLSDGQSARVAPLVEARGYEPRWIREPWRLRWWESPGMTLPVRRGPSITGRVTDGEGRPVAGAEVRIGFKVRGGITSAPPQVGFGWRGRRTDEAGRFDWIAYPGSAAGRAKGEWVVVIQHPLFERAEVTDLPGRAVDDEGCIPLSISLREGLRLHGRILGPHGEPIPGALVRLTPRDRQAGGPGDLRWGRTDDDGRFRLGGLLPRSHVIHAWAEGMAPGSLEVDLPSEGEVVLDLGEGSHLSGQVVDAHGKGIPGVEVQGWPSPPGSPGRGRTDEEGKFRISALPPEGGIALHLWHPLHESRHEITLPSEPVRIGFPLVDFRARLFSAETDRPLESCGQILFRRPVAGIEGIPIRRGGDAGPVSLRPGLHDMTAVVPHRRAKEFRVSIPEWGLKTPVDIWMSKGRRLPGQTVDLEGRPLPGIRITAHGDRHGEEQVVLSDPSGSFLLRGLGASIHIVADGDGWAQSILDDPDPDSPLEIRMGPGAVLSGTLATAKGDPISGVEVLARMESHAWETLTDGEGRYRFTRLPVGEYALSAGRSRREVKLSHGESRVVDFAF